MVSRAARCHLEDSPMTRHRVGLLPYWLVAPTLLIVVAFIIYPVIETFRLSFTDTNLLLAARIPPKFVGFATYGKALSDPLLPTVLKNTVIWVFVGTLLTLLIGVAIGYYLSFDWKINRLLRAGLLIPWIIPSVVIAAAWKWMYNDQLGVINDILKRLGVIHEGIPFLGLPQWVIFPLTFVVAWRAAPLTAMVVSAAIQGVPTSLLEAATIDGANGWQEFRYVTLPGLRLIILVVMIFRIISTFNGFDLVWLLTGGGPGNSTRVLSIEVFNRAFVAYQMGRAASLTTLMFIVLGIMVFLLLTLQREEAERRV